MEILIVLAAVLLCIWIGAHIIVGFFNFVEWFFASFFRAFVAFGFMVMVFFWAVVTFNQPHGHSTQQQAAYEPATPRVAETGSSVQEQDLRKYIAIYGEAPVRNCYDGARIMDGVDSWFPDCIRALKPL